MTAHNSATSNCPATVPVNRRERQHDRRRSNGGVNLRHLGLRPRRQQSRRAADDAGSYTDWYDARLLASSLGIIICSCLDAFFTLNLLQLGATELNLLMAGLIEKDVRIFVNFKVSVTALSVILLVIHNNFRIFSSLRVEYLLHFAFAAYLVLIGYELALLRHIPI